MWAKNICEPKLICGPYQKSARCWIWPEGLEFDSVRGNQKFPGFHSVLHNQSSASGIMCHCQGNMGMIFYSLDRRFLWCCWSTNEGFILVLHSYLKSLWPGPVFEPEGQHFIVSKSIFWNGSDLFCYSDFSIKAQKKHYCQRLPHEEKTKKPKAKNADNELTNELLLGFPYFKPQCVPGFCTYWDRFSLLLTCMSNHRSLTAS